MIKITIRYQSTGEFLSLESLGHANSAPHGEDLVCAAVSGILLGGINALKDECYSLKTDEKKGNLVLCNIGKMSQHDNIVIETVISQLQAIERDNPKFISISVK